MSELARATRRKLFDLYSRNLSLYDPTMAGIFVCPLCLKGFDRTALDGPDPSLTLAHVISESLGGRWCTLTCKSCNNDAGSRLEADLVERLAIEDRAAGIGRLNARLSGTFGDVGVEIELAPGDGPNAIEVIGRQSHPAHIESLQQQFRELANNPESEFTLTVHLRLRARWRPIRAALYQSAYLLMFSHFGYEFVFHPHFAPLREQITRPNEDIWETPILAGDEMTTGKLLRGRDSAVVLTREPEVILAVLRLRPDGGRGRIFGVLLPGLDKPDPPVQGIMTFPGSCIITDPPWFLLGRPSSLRELRQRTREPHEQEGQGAVL